MTDEDTAQPEADAAVQIDPEREEEFRHRWRELVGPVSPAQNGEHERIGAQLALEFVLAGIILELRERFGGGFDRQFIAPLEPLLIHVGTSGAAGARDAYERIELLLEFATQD